MRVQHQREHNQGIHQPNQRIIFEVVEESVLHNWRTN